MKPIKILTSIASLGTFISKAVTITDNYTKETQSFEDIASQTITELYLFRYHIQKVKPNKIHETIHNLNNSLATFNNTSITISEDKYASLMHLGLVTNSINFSLSRLVELLETFNKNDIAWKKESTTATLTECQKTVIVLNEQFNAMKSDESVSINVEEKLKDLDNTLTTLQKLL
jgi:hypothetical protein